MELYVTCCARRTAPRTRRSSEIQNRKGHHKFEFLNSAQVILFHSIFSISKLSRARSCSEVCLKNQDSKWNDELNGTYAHCLNIGPDVVRCKNAGAEMQVHSHLVLR